MLVIQGEDLGEHIYGEYKIQTCDLRVDAALQLQKNIQIRSSLQDSKVWIRHDHGSSLVNRILNGSWITQLNKKLVVL